MSLGYTCEFNTSIGWVLAWSEKLPVGAEYRGITQVTEAAAETMNRITRTAAIMPSTKVSPTGSETEYMARIGDSAAWMQNLDPMPDTGTLALNSVWRWGGKAWKVIGQGFDRAIYGGDPAQYVSLCAEKRDPFRVAPWTTTGQFTAYMLANDITGLPEQCTHLGFTWQTRRNLNTWEPGGSDSGWLKISHLPAAWIHVGNEGYPLNWEVTHTGRLWRSPTNNNFWEPIAPQWTNIGPAPA
jgi:hypothetical protein